MNKKIFIQIASYRDPELLPTIKDCIDKAKNPENLVFSITWQHSEKDTWDTLDEFKDDPRFRIIDVKYSDSKGACWARHLLQQQYDGEEYTLQLDSHHRFTQDWDETIINMYEGLKADGVAKPLLTGYISPYDPENDPEGRVTEPYLMNFDRFIPEGAVFFRPAVIPGWEKLEKPIPARFYSAHFCFTSGKFVEEVPHDPNLYFHGEEISIAVRAFTHGYDLFHPHRVVAWHEYTRKGRTKQWDDDKAWVAKNNSSHRRNRTLFGMDGEIQNISFGPYGFGNVRTLKDYEHYAGISFKNRAVQQYTLDDKIAPNPPMSDEEFEKSLTKIFKHFIDIHKSVLPKDRECDFWAVIFENENGEAVYRKDITEPEMTRHKQVDGDFMPIEVSFLVEKKPYKWIFWPHAKDGEWLQREEKVM